MLKFITGGFGKVPEEILAIYPKINVSGIKQFNTSPAYYESCQILNEVEPTKAMDLGTKLHYAILEPEKFEALFCPEPGEIPLDVVDTLDDLKEWCKREGLKVSGTKADLVGRLRDHGTKFRTMDEYIQEITQGRQLLSKKELHAAKRIISRIKSIKAIDSILTGGQVEQLGWVLLDAPRVIISFRVDYFKPLSKPIAGYENFAIDAKTSSMMSTHRDLQRFIANDDAQIQFAVYSDALTYLTKKNTAAAILAVETTPPYNVMLQVIGAATIECGRAEAYKNLCTFAECHAAGVYPTGFETIGTVEIPNWKLTEIENKEAKRLEEMEGI